MSSIFFTILFGLLALTFAPKEAFSAQFINDSLVENLDCSKVSPNEIYSKVRPEAFSATYHFPLKNWGFSVGLYDIAACWSLARSQRLFYYLARWNDPSRSDIQKMTYDLLEMLRGSSPYAHVSDPFVNEWPLSEFEVFHQNERTWDITSPAWGALLQGFKQDFPNGSRLHRHLKSEIEFYQNRRFHDFIRNIKYVIGDGSRSPEKNRETRNKTLRNLEMQKLTLLLLRPKRTSQHVVLAKKFQIKSNGEIDIIVYDSNYPFQDQILTFNPNDSEFYAPNIVRGLPEVSDPQTPIGVFIVDEKDRDPIEKTLVKFYKKQCQK